MTWKLSDKQKAALKLIESNKYTCLIGQGRSGKTLAIMYLLFKRAIQYPKTSHCVFRNTLQSAVDGIFKITIPEVITNFYPALPFINGFQINKSSYEITFHNGSRICIKGLDDKERSQKILSTQWATIFVDEAHLVDYSYIGLLLTRTPQPVDVDYKIKIITAANWAPKTNWLKFFFLDGVNPETKAKHNQQCGFLSFQTSDNKYIDFKEYIDTLQSAGDRKSKLMCAGQDFYDEIEGALWQQSDIIRADSKKIEEYDYIVIAFDPAVSNNKKSDAHGVCIAAKHFDEYHILKCFEKKADINVIAQEVAELYHQYNCAKLIFETNQGSDWVSSLINNFDPSVYCSGVRATKGKLLRAEPVAGLYKNKYVKHCGHFPELEDQMVTYSGTGDSPNALDAMVYALQYLKEEVKFVNPDDYI